MAPRDELALLDAVAQQPVAVGIDASQYAFMFYKVSRQWRTTQDPVSRLPAQPRPPPAPPSAAVPAP